MLASEAHRVPLSEARIILRKTLGSHLAFLALLILVSGSQVIAQKRPVHIDYIVDVSNPETSVFHVTANVTNINQARLDLSLPVWTPGWYTIENYVKNILRFKITDEKGANLPHIMTRKQTWSVDTKGHQIKIEFELSSDGDGAQSGEDHKRLRFFHRHTVILNGRGPPQ